MVNADENHHADTRAAAIPTPAPAITSSTKCCFVNTHAHPIPIAQADSIIDHTRTVGLNCQRTAAMAA